MSNGQFAHKGENMKKKIITLLTCVLAIFSLTGCVGIRSNKTSTEKKQDEDYVINDGRT